MAKIPNHREAVILALLVSGEKYGRELRGEYQRETGEKLPLGSLYVTLRRMEDKGLLRSKYGKSTSERGGNRRKYFRVSGTGATALRAYELRGAEVGRLGLAHGE